MKTISAYAYLSDVAARLSVVSDSPRVEAELFGAHFSGLSRTAIYSEGLSSDQRDKIEQAVKRRLLCEPLQYITGVQWFRGLALKVGTGVLIPRPETEITVDVALRQIAGVHSPVVIDIGTGSGAIALSIATERPDARVIAIEKDPAAFGWASRNLGSSAVTLIQGDLFDVVDENLKGIVDLVVSNPPYLSSTELAASADEVRCHEPTVALLADDDGFAITNRLIDESCQWLCDEGSIVVETSPSLKERVSDAVARRFGIAEVVPDLVGRARAVVGTGRSQRPC